jgi:hypothetical protein
VSPLNIGPVVGQGTSAISQRLPPGSVIICIDFVFLSTIMQ